MKDELNIPLFEMIICLSEAIDLISQEVNGHHKRVAYIANSIATEMGLSEQEQRDLIVAGALHDAGAFSLRERLNALEFEESCEYDQGEKSEHAEMGYKLIKRFKPFAKIAPLIRYHHVLWDGGKGAEIDGDVIPIGGHILHLADRVDVLINKKIDILNQKDDICRRIERESNEMFIPEAVEAFLSLAKKEAFWFNTTSSNLTRILAKKSGSERINLNLDGLLSLARLFSDIIDFRCQFIATHSSGVAASAEILAELAGFKRKECVMMKVAGYLHDLGKLAVPPEILNKPAKLTKREFNIIKQHPFYTYRILDRVNGLEEINHWAALHHERLDGTGYPFHYNEDYLPIGSRIMAVADVFTAVSEDRPYRKGMRKDKVLNILKDMSSESALDAEIVLIIEQYYDEINRVRQFAQNQEIKKYGALHKVSI